MGKIEIDIEDLREIEWHGYCGQMTDESVCPSCGREKAYLKHDDDCWIRIALSGESERSKYEEMDE